MSVRPHAQTTAPVVDLSDAPGAVARACAAWGFGHGLDPALLAAAMAEARAFFAGAPAAKRGLRQISDYRLLA